MRRPWIPTRRLPWARPAPVAHDQRAAPGAAYPRKPRFRFAKRPMLGSTSGMSESATPNQRASVAEYSSTDVDLIQQLLVMRIVAADLAEEDLAALREVAADLDHPGGRLQLSAQARVREDRRQRRRRIERRADLDVRVDGALHHLAVDVLEQVV